MNPLTQIKNTIKATAREAALGLGEDASWHARFKHSAYVFAGGLDFALTEGDVLSVFSQYGEIVDVHLARDKATGKSKGFAFLAYEDQRSTVLAVDNLNGATVAGRRVRVEHVDNYKKRRALVRGGGGPGAGAVPRGAVRSGRKSGGSRAWGSASLPTAAKLPSKLGVVASSWGSHPALCGLRLRQPAAAARPPRAPRRTKGPAPPGPTPPALPADRHTVA
jgi:RNA-binding motif X-linked protein 2